MSEDPPAPEELARLRERLNAIDARLVSALAERQSVVERVGALKARSTALLRDVRREEELLGRIVHLGRDAGLDAHFVTRIYHEILEQSVRRQQEQLLGRDNPERDVSRPLAVGYLGAEGTYSHQAAARHFGGRDEDVRFKARASFDQLVADVLAGDSDYAVLPIENTTAGSINEVYDLLAAEPVHIVGEEVQRVDHALVGHPGVDFAAVTTILGHPQALAQCRRFLGRMSHCRIEAVADTATGLRRVAEGDDPTVAAIGNDVGARRFGLAVLWPGIANQRANLTRFVVVAQRPLSCDERIAAKTSLVFSVPHRRGTLLAALNVFYEHDLNLTKLESRPKTGEAWNYRFYVDFLGHLSPATLDAVLAELGPLTSELKYLGTYPAKTDHVPAEPRLDGEGPTSS